MVDVDHCTSSSGIYQTFCVIIPKDGFHRLSRACVKFLTSEQILIHAMDSSLP
jgi:hypothetical protein